MGLVSPMSVVRSKKSEGALWFSYIRPPNKWEREQVIVFWSLVLWIPKGPLSSNPISLLLPSLSL